MNTPYVIGINGGGTRTTMVLATNQIEVLARVEVGGSNPTVIGWDKAQVTLRDGIRALLDQAGAPMDQVAAIGAGLAGMDRPADHVAFTEIFNQIAPNAALSLDNDAVPALVAAAGRRYGIVTISGTGMIALGINQYGERARAGGWGHFADYGSGYAAARDVISAIWDALDGSGPQTALTQRVLARLNLDNTDALVDWLYAPDRRIDQVSALAAEAVTLAESGDVASKRVIARAADALARCVATVLRKLKYTAPFPLVMTGSLFTYSPMLRDLFTATVRAYSPNAIPMITDREAAIGAALMALEVAGQPLPDTAFPEPSNAITLTMRRATEKPNRLTLGAHRLSTFDFISLMNIEDERIARLIVPELPRIATLIDAVADRFRQGGRLLYAGAGTSGRLVVLDASECPPTFGTPPERVVGIVAGGYDALTKASEGMEDSEQAGREVLAALNAGPLDSVIGVAASGTTPFVQGVMREAINRGALTGCIVNAVNAPISVLAEYPVVVPTGPEVILGSTRLKAGTAQKMILNMISTGLMLRVGRVYSNLMTDMKLSNAKLRDRARHIVVEATGLSLEKAGELLTECGNEMKTAIAAALLNLTPDEARARLAAVDGDLGQVVDAEKSRSGG